MQFTHIYSRDIHIVHWWYIVDEIKFKKGPSFPTNQLSVFTGAGWYSVLLCLDSHILFHLLDNETETELKM
jgi:hypothetical protein